jgi:hypothetical protein
MCSRTVACFRQIGDDVVHDENGNKQRSDVFSINPLNPLSRKSVGLKVINGSLRSYNEREHQYASCVCK